jgi:CBS domain containing-hemolysin-like protein
VTGAEIEYLIEMGTREGVLDKVKEELLNSVLEFADRVVREVMVPRTRMVALDKDLPVDQILRIVAENPYSRMPVYDGSIDNVIGILLVRDIVAELARGTLGTVPLERFAKPAFFVPEQMKVSKLLKEMQRRRSHLAVVVDEFGGTAGLCTLEDVIEEIVGEIQDEADAEAAKVKPIGDGLYLADAAIPLRELEEFLNHKVEGLDEDREHAIRFPEDGDFETLGGFLTATAGRVPQVGALIAWNGLEFTVRAGDERRVTRVEISRSAGAGPRAAPRPAAAAQGRA